MELEKTGILTTVNWEEVVFHCLVSRALDDLEEQKLVPERKVVYQFSSRGHELAQVLLGTLLTHPHDGVGAYYRARPLMIQLGVPLEDIIAGPLMKAGGYSDGRDVGVVCNFPNPGGPTVLPLAGDVGSQFTPTAGWAQAIQYFRDELGDPSYQGAIAVVTAGDGAVAANGFWSSLTIATTLELPMLFLIEDNGYGISVPASFQTPGGNIAQNLAAFGNLKVLDGDGTDPVEAFSWLKAGVEAVRSGKGPVLVRLTVPRLSGHSGQDTQAYKEEDLISREKASDPLLKLKQYLVPGEWSEEQWHALEKKAHSAVIEALDSALKRPEPDSATVTDHVFFERDDPEGWQRAGGMVGVDRDLPESSDEASDEPGRVNMISAIRRTLEHELAVNPRVLIFGEDVGPKGGVHTATLGLQEAFGENRVFDTSLSEEGIIGRAVGMSLAGLAPVAEIQFRKYADPAMEQLHNCGSLRWRTANRFAAPIVVRMPGGFAKIGDPWHSVSNEVAFAHAVGWEMIYPSNARDAVGLLRAAMRSNNPSIFFEHRALLDAASARTPYPGDHFILPLGKASVLLTGEDLTIVSWGAMVERCQKAIAQSNRSVELIDLRTIMPWDNKAVLRSVRKTHRCLIVHEDAITAGFGAEIAATLAREAFFDLDAPIERLAVPDIPVPHNPGLMEAMLPGVDEIAAHIENLITL